MDLVEYMLISSALSTNKSSAVAEMGDCLAAIDIGQKVGRGCASFCGGGSGVPIQHNVAWAKAYRRTKWYPNASSHLATIHIGRKVGATVPLLEGEWVPIQHNVAWAEAYRCTKWHLDPSSRLATIDMDRKVGGCCALSGRGELGPNLTQCGLGRGVALYQVAS